MSQYLTSRISRVEVSYGFEQSDHTTVLVEMHINADIEVGPGLIKVNSTVLNNPSNLVAVKGMECLHKYPQTGILIRDWNI